MWAQYTPTSIFFQTLKILWKSIALACAASYRIPAGPPRIALWLAFPYAEPCSYPRRTPPGLGFAICLHHWTHTRDSSQAHRDTGKLPSVLFAPSGLPDHWANRARGISYMYYRSQTSCPIHISRMHGPLCGLNTGGLRQILVKNFFFNCLGSFVQEGPLSKGTLFPSPLRLPIMRYFTLKFLWETIILAWAASY
jgi:hypothetical protein